MFRFKKINPLLSASLVFIGILSGCTSDNPIPKKTAYLRIDLPEKSYRTVTVPDCPYSFEAEKAALMVRPSDMPETERCWSTLVYPRFKAEVFLTYKDINKAAPLRALVEDLHQYTYSHQIKAERIYSEKIQNIHPQNGATIFHVQGNVASNIQFFVTDSTHHFLRGALMFRTNPNKDSLAPVLAFIEQDIKHLMQTLTWN